MAKGKVIGLIFGVVVVIGSIFMLNNAWSNVNDAQKWVAYEYGVCRFVDGYTEQECLDMAGPVSWPAINGKQAYDKYYGEDKTDWMYGENPRLGLGPLAN